MYLCQLLRYTIRILLFLINDFTIETNEHGIRKLIQFLYVLCNIEIIENYKVGY